MTNDLVILYGSGRSGTSWLHLMIGAHPAVVTGQQSRVFSRYLLPLYERWLQEIETARQGKGRIHGISCFLTEEDVIGQIRAFADKVFSVVEAGKPGARLVLENQPGDAMSLPLIAKCFPRVKFIHSIRDGRDAALSLFLGYERFELPDLATAAHWWRERTALGLEGKNLGTDYIEVKYEDLQTAGPEELHRVFKSLGVESTLEQATRIYDEYSFEKVRAGKHHSPFVNPGKVAASGTQERPEPSGFFRAGSTEQWRSLFSRRDLRIFNSIGGGLLEQLGYTPCDPSELPMFRQSIETVAGRLGSALLRTERTGKKVAERVLRALDRPRRRDP